MTDKVLQLAAEIEKLTEIVPAVEAKAFLKARFNLPASELSTYLGFAQTLKGSEEVLRKTRPTSFHHPAREIWLLTGVLGYRPERSIFVGRAAAVLVDPNIIVYRHSANFLIVLRPE